MGHTGWGRECAASLSILGQDKNTNTGDGDPRQGSKVQGKTEGSGHHPPRQHTEASTHAPTSTHTLQPLNSPQT
jgi:hypothetical protein